MSTPRAPSERQRLTFPASVGPGALPLRDAGLPDLTTTNRWTTTSRAPAVYVVSGAPDELRNRLIVCVYALVGGCALSSSFVDRPKPSNAADGELMGGRLIVSPDRRLRADEVFGALGGLFIALPIIFFSRGETSFLALTRLKP